MRTRLLDRIILDLPAILFTCITGNLSESGGTHIGLLRIFGFAHASGYRFRTCGYTLITLFDVVVVAVERMSENALKTSTESNQTHTIHNPRLRKDSCPGA